MKSTTLFLLLFHSYIFLCCHNGSFSVAYIYFIWLDPLYHIIALLSHIMILYVDWSFVDNTHIIYNCIYRDRRNFSFSEISENNLADRIKITLIMIDQLPVLNLMATYFVIRGDFLVVVFNWREFYFLDYGYLLNVHISKWKTFPVCISSNFHIYMLW